MAIVTLVRDDFNRANGALGTAPTGQTWLHSGTRQVAVSGNVAIGAAGGADQDASYIDAGVTSYTLSAKLWNSTAPDLNCGLVWRLSDGSNYHLILLTNGPDPALFYYTFEAGEWVSQKYNTTEDYYAVPNALETWVPITVVVTPESNEIYLGENLLAFPSDSAFNANATGVGILLNATSQAIDDFLVTHEVADAVGGGHGAVTTRGPRRRLMVYRVGNVWYEEVRRLK